MSYTTKASPTALALHCDQSLAATTPSMCKVLQGAATRSILQIISCPGRVPCNPLDHGWYLYAHETLQGSSVAILHFPGHPCNGRPCFIFDNILFLRPQLFGFYSVWTGDLICWLYTHCFWSKRTLISMFNSCFHVHFTKQTLLKLFWLSCGLVRGFMWSSQSCSFGVVLLPGLNLWLWWENQMGR